MDALSAATPLTNLIDVNVIKKALWNFRLAVRIKLWYSSLYVEIWRKYREKNVTNFFWNSDFSSNVKNRNYYFFYGLDIPF